MIGLYAVMLFAIFLTYPAFNPSFGQTNISDATNKMKVPSHLDIESQSTQQEMSAIKNEPPNSTNVTEQIPNKTISTNDSNQSLQFTNGTVNVTEIIPSRPLK